MINSHTKIFIIALSALLFLSTGCEKDEDTSYTFRLETSSLDFEWGQTKELAVAVANIESFGTPSVPEGWTCVRQGHKYVITAPTQTNTTTGKIDVFATTKSGMSVKRSVTVSIRIAREIDVAANSIIISEPNQRFKFKPLKRGNETTGTITGAAGAVRVWTTSAESVTNVSLEGDYLYFATGTSSELTEGNAVIAVTDRNGNILWSWHIWVTDYDPDDDTSMAGNLRVMNRNLGAFSGSAASPEDAGRSYGLYYQWGRKDPFIGPVAWNSTTPRTIYDASNMRAPHSYEVSSAKNGTVEWAVAHPGTFIAGAKDNDFDWLFSGHKTDLWSSSSKTIHDPCPEGWRIAPRELWKDFTATGGASSDPAEFNVEGEYEYGWTFTMGDERLFFPAAGRRSFSPSLASASTNFTNVVNNADGVGFPVGFYWSGNHPSSGAGALAFRHDLINPGDSTSDIAAYAPSGGFPVRCVADN